MQTLEIIHHIPADQQGRYLLLPFEMPPSTERVDIEYTYLRNREENFNFESGQFTAQERVNRIDLALLAPDGSQVGASGSSRDVIFVSTTDATPGYQPHPLKPGTWQIMLGAYVVSPDGVDVHISLRFTPKTRRWFKGDLHTHTLASDGQLTLDHLARHARTHGLDFIAVTDHNQPVKRASFPKIEGLTIIPGLEWTHYKGHSNFLGIEDPYTGSFFANTEEEALDKFRQARKNGALISINHPLESDFGFHFDLEKIPYDLIEVWNGPMRPRNIETIAWWDQMLKAGKRQVAVCGSDYHEDTVFQRLANPTMNVFAWSASEKDLLEAIESGHSYFTYSPTDLHIDLNVNDATYGVIKPWREGLMADIQAFALEAGDQIRLIDQDGQRVLFNSPQRGDWQSSLPVEKRGYIRLEVWRTFFPGLPPMPALVTNPIWFE
ncbi:MAG: CehA/McbA family metallohydrolase [Anaerolineaceae bacterium]|jgi:hypothetical protein|nr:CehA/McbA family metallohydrolase [Anaerolineaceae bacterium]MDD4042482.1 CehA/McbA family metallohydrolase [Anaerolineaceae bacterium]